MKGSIIEIKELWDEVAMREFWVISIKTDEKPNIKFNQEVNI